jgi:hypothetical protein
MPSIELISLLLAVVVAFCSGAYKLALSNYQMFEGALIVLYPILVFSLGVVIGLQFSNVDQNIGINLPALFVTGITLVASLFSIKEMTKPKK